MTYSPKKNLFNLSNIVFNEVVVIIQLKERYGVENHCDLRQSETLQYALLEGRLCKSICRDKSLIIYSYSYYILQLQMFRRSSNYTSLSEEAFACYKTKTKDQ